MKTGIIAVVVAVVAFGMASGASTTKEVLDAMFPLHELDGETYDEATWAAIEACFASEVVDGIDPHAASDIGWEGYFAYYETDGQPDGSDPWRQLHWIEWNPTMMGGAANSSVPEVLVNEPCNFVSNAAYCRTAVAMCAHTARGGWAMPPAAVTGLVRSYANLCMGSAFFHGSGTSLGGTLDNQPIGHLALISHQASLEALPYNPILHDIRSTPADGNGIGWAEEMTVIVLNASVYEWNDLIRQQDLPSYYYTFGATVDTIFNLVFPAPIATRLAELIFPLFLNNDQVDFILNEYEPLLQQSFVDNDVDLDLPTTLDFGGRSIGTLVKMMYAFVWQEELIPGPWLHDEEANNRGAEVMPDVNALGNSLSGYAHTDDDIQNCVDVYPADDKCRRQEPHSKWHEQSGNALVDLMWLTDDIDRCIRGVPLEARSLASSFVLPLEACAARQGCAADLLATGWTMDFPVWAVDGLSGCLPVLWREWPARLDYTGFARCMLLPALGATAAALPADSAEMCLVDCLLQPDVTTIGACLDAPACTNATAATATLGAARACLPALLASGDVPAFVGCVSTPTSTAYTTAALAAEAEAAFPGVTPAVAAAAACFADASSSSSSCGAEASAAMATALRTAECTQWCWATPVDVFHPMPWFTLPRELGCALECYLDTAALRAARHPAPLV